MTRDEVERKLITILRSKLLRGSNRPMDLDAPLGGLDIDSLALLEFMASVEAEFEVEIPDKYWMEPQWTLTELGQLLERTSGDHNDIH